MKFRQAGSPGEFEVELTPVSSGSVRARIDGEEIVTEFEPASAEGALVRIGRRAARIFSTHQRGSILVTVGPAQFEFIQVGTRTARRAHGLATPEITAPMPGKVVKLLVTEGQQVEAGEALVILEAMKMETALRAEGPGIIKQIRVEVGQMVDHGAALLVLSPAPPKDEAGSAAR
jgi:biotin carboxyl carrier protein